MVMNLLSVGRQMGMADTQKASVLTTAVFRIENEFGAAAFSELAGINSEIEQIEYMEAGEKGPQFARFIGKAKPPTITLKRSMSSGTDTTWIWEWHQVARSAHPSAYRTTYLKLYGAGVDVAGDPDVSYTLVNAWPTKVEVSAMKAGGTEVVLQTVTLQCDEIMGAA